MPRTMRWHRRLAVNSGVGDDPFPACACGHRHAGPAVGGVAHIPGATMCMLGLRWWQASLGEWWFVIHSCLHSAIKQCPENTSENHNHTLLIFATFDESLLSLPCRLHKSPNATCSTRHGQRHLWFGCCGCLCGRFNIYHESMAECFTKAVQKRIQHANNMPSENKNIWTGY